MKLNLCFKLIFTFFITLLCQQGFGQEVKWVKTNLNELSTNDEVVIVDENANGSNYALGNSNGTGSAPQAIIVTVTTQGDDVILSTPVEDRMKWEIIVNNSNYQFKVPGSNNYLYATNSNNGVRVGSGTSNLFTSYNDNGYIGFKVNTNPLRYLGVYNNQDWRTYETVHANIIKTRIAIYKKTTSIVSNQVDKPTISVLGTTTGEENSYYNSAEIELATSTPEASIYYSTDDSVPTSSSTLYEGAFIINETTSVKAIAVKDGMDDSDIASLDVTIQIPTINTATIPYQEQFSNTLGIWINKIVSGNTNFSGWGSSIDGATINGYNQGVTESYLISPKFTNNSDLDLKLTFDYTSQYNGNNLKVLISTDYNGYGDPSIATWSELSVINSTSMSGSLNQEFDNPGSDFHLALFYNDNYQWKKWNINNLKLEYDIKIPEALPATNIEDTSFKANWIPVDNINQYELDVYTGENEIIYLDENFDWANGTGGNDGSWSGSIASAKIENDNNQSNFEFVSGYLANKSVKLGTGSVKGSLKTPVLIGLNGNATLTFRAGAWNSNNEQTTLKLNIEGGGTLSQSSVEMVKGVFTSYTINIIDATSNTRITFEGKNASNSRFFIDDIKIFKNSRKEHIVGSPFTVNQANIKEITGVNLEENTYYYVVRSVVGNSKSEESNEIKVYNRTTWDGTKWDNGLPNETIHAVVKGDLIIGQDSDINNLTARSLKLNETRAILVESGSFINLKDQLINLSGTPIEFEEGAYLIQENDVTNIGKTKFYRNASFYRYDSKFWSSPVAGQNIEAFMPSSSAVYNYNTINRNWDNTTDTNFLSAKGYAIQAGTSYPFFGHVNDVEFEGRFTGVPHNGDYRVSVTTEGLGDNGMGNPYGSPISTTAFFEENDHVTRLYFWNEEAHYDPTVTPVGYNKQTWFALNKTGSNNGPGKLIGVGVGFIARVNSNDDVIFKNSMRNIEETDDNIFNRNNEEVDRFWLSLNSDNNKNNQILIGYVEGATNGIDEKYDAKNISNNNSFILSHSNANAMIIEGRQYPLDINDQIPLYFRAKKTGDYTIKLENKEGIFNSQPIYLVDNELNLSINLNEEIEYTFDSDLGNFTDRFEIRYQPKITLNLSDINEEINLVIYKNEGVNKVTSKEDVISYKIFDVSGKLIKTVKLNPLKSFVLPTLDIGTYIIKFSLENGTIINKKVIY